MLSGGPRTSQTADTRSVVTLPETRVTGTPVVVSEQTFARDPVTANLVQLPQVQNVIIRQERPVYESRTQNVQLEITREVPKLIEKIVEYPVEVIVEKPVEQRITVDVVHEKVVDIPIEIVNEVQTEQIFLHPVEMIREKLVYKDSFVDKPIIQEVRVPKEYITTREVPVIVEVPTQVDRTVFQPIETQVSKRVEVRKTQVFETKDVIKEVQVPVDRIVDVQVPRYVDHVVEREEVIQMPGNKIKREIPKSKDVIIPKAVYREVEVPVDILITQDGQRLELGRRDPSGRYPGLTSERSRSLSNQRLSGVTSSRNFQPDILRPQNPTQVSNPQILQRGSNRAPVTVNTTTYGSNPAGNITYSFGANGGLVPTQTVTHIPRGSNTNFRTENDPRTDRGIQIQGTGYEGNSNTASTSNLYRQPSSGNLVTHSNLVPQLGSLQKLSYQTTPAANMTPANQTHYYSSGANYASGVPATSQPTTQTIISGAYVPTQQPQRLSGSSNGVVITSRPQQQAGAQIYTSLGPSSFQNNQPLDSRFTKETNPTLRFTQETTNNNVRFTNPDQSPRRLQDVSTHSTPGAAQPTYSVGLSDRGSYAARNTGEVSRNLFSAGHPLNNSSSGEVIRELVPSAHRPAGAPATASGLEPIQEVRNDSMQSSSLNGGYELGHDITTPPGRLGGEARQEPLSQPRFYVSEPRAGAPLQQSSSSSALHQTQTVSRAGAGARIEPANHQTTSRSGSVSRRVVSEQVRLPPGYREGEPAVYFHRDKVIPKYVEQIIEKYRDIPVERRVEVPYETIREQIINNDIIQEREVEVIRRVPGPVEEEFVEREIEVLKVVERPIYMTKKVQIIKEIIVEKEVEEPHETFVERIIEREVDVDVPINSITQRASIVETPVDCTTRRRRRTSAVNERLRQSLRESVERSNSISRENAELHSRVRLLMDRKNSTQGGESSMREDKNKQEFESLKQRLEGLTDKLNELETVDRQARLTHQTSSN